MFDAGMSAEVEQDLMNILQSITIDANILELLCQCLLESCLAKIMDRA